MISQKDEMFILGSAAAARAGNCSPRYVCPLCRLSFFEAEKEQLSIEHVPAKSLGGMPLILTCKACNNEAGHLLQGHQTEKERQGSFWVGNHEKPLNVEVKMNTGAVIRGEATFSDKTKITVNVDLNRMSPHDIKQLQEDAEHLTYDSYKIGKNYDARKARIADLRDAYLWVFARYGYTAIAHKFCDWIRDSIKNGKATHDRWAVDIANSPAQEYHEKAGKPLIFRLENPANTLLICNGNSGVLFPTIFNQDPYSALDDDKAMLTIVPNHSECVPEKMSMGFDFITKVDPVFT